MQRAVEEVTSTALSRLLPPSTALALRIHAHLIPLLVLVLETHLAIDDGEQRVVGGAAHVHAGMELGAPLLHEDRARRDVLSGEALDAEILRSGVAAVAGRTDTLLVCHLSSVALELDVGDLDFRELLAMPTVAPVAAAPREAVDLDLLALAVPDDLGGHLGPLHHRLPRVHLLAVARQQDVVERHLAPGLGREQRDLDGDPGLGAELRAAGGENGVGHEAAETKWVQSVGQVGLTPPHTVL